jgi:predicted ATPase
VAGEALYPVPPLGLPGRGTAMGTLTTYAAVRLFIDRALAVQPAFVVNNDNAPALAAVCATLEGIPLAIELAAARLRSLSLESLATRLGDRFHLLTGGGRGDLPHHQTLRAAIDWSHNLLTLEEQVLFRRLSVFAGGWTLEAAEAICAGEGIDAPDIFDLLDSLVDKSLVLADLNDEGDVRYGLLETVRQYAVEKLTTAAETTAVLDRHYAYYLATTRAYQSLREQLDAEVTVRRKFHRFNRAELDNFRVALTHGGTKTSAYPLAVALNIISCPEARGWLLRLLAGDSGAVTSDLAETYAALAASAATLAENAQYLEQAIALFRQLGDTRRLVHIMLYHVQVLLGLGQEARSSACRDECIALARRNGDPRLLVEALLAEAGPAIHTGDGARARPLLKEALALQPQGEHCSTIHTMLAQFAYYSGEYLEAAAHADEAIRLERFLGKTPLIALRCRGDVQRAQGRFAEARAVYLASMANAWGTDNVPVVHCALVRFGALAAAEGEFPRAVRHIAAAEGLREGADFPLPPTEAREIEPALAVAKAALSPEDYQTAWMAGQALSLREALATCRAEEETRAKNA